MDSTTASIIGSPESTTNSNSKTPSRAAENSTSGQVSRTKKYELFLKLKLRTVFISRCCKAGIVVSTYRRKGVDLDLLLQMQCRHLRVQEKELSELRKKYSHFWWLFPQQVKDQIWTKGNKLKKHLKQKFSKLKVNPHALSKTSANGAKRNKNRDSTQRYRVRKWKKMD